MSFAIVQWAYKSILKIFNLVYSELIENDYHSKIWREDTEIILKKSDKSNYSILIIIIIIFMFLWYWLNQLMRDIYAMCVKRTKLSEIENRSLSIWWLHVVEMIELRLCIKFVRDDCMLKNERSCHSELLQQFHFYHHSCCHLKIFRDWNNYLIVQRLIAFSIEDEFSSNNAWEHAWLSNDFIRSCIALYSCLKCFLSADRHSNLCVWF